VKFVTKRYLKRGNGRGFVLLNADLKHGLKPTQEPPFLHGTEKGLTNEI